MDWQRRVHCIRDVIGHPPYGHDTREIALLRVLQGKNIDTYTIHKSDAWVFSIFEAFVLFAQAPDEGNENLTGIYSGHTWVCVMVKLIVALTLTIWPEKESYGCHTFVLFVS